MKRINLWILILIPFVFSCTEEEFQLDNKINEIESRVARTTCDILGNREVCQNSTNAYTYTSDFGGSNVNWIIVSGDISISSGQGTTQAVMQFGSNFSGGSIRAIGGGQEVCSETITISELIAPTSISISQNTVSGACSGEIFTFSATGGSGSYQWQSFQGSVIISGQGTSTVRIQSPSTGGFSVRATSTNSCGSNITGFTLAQFNSGCGGSGF